MNNYNKCDICGEPPVFYFKHEEWGSEWQKIRGIDHEDAALIFAEKYNIDCELINEETEVEIKNQKGEIKKFIVSAEQDINYSARENVVGK